MLMIRLARFGAKKKPFYRVVVIEKERARNGRNLEVLGHYNPVSSPAQVELKRDRLEYWTKNGAQMSDTVKRLLATHPAVAAPPGA
jgi:small subunit ribosomal protein S16